MKFGLLVGKTLADGTCNGFKNIGDYMQNLAAMQFLPNVDEYYDRDGDNNGSEHIKMIMNAWYCWRPRRFPVEERIEPLPISMHISPMVEDELLSDPKVYQWFQKYQPIGCRDTGTVERLRRYGIKAYFSGCLTLTLGVKYKSNEKSGKLLMVDPYLDRIGTTLGAGDCFRAFLFSLRHLRSFFSVLGKIKHHYFTNGKLIWLKKLAYTCVFLRTYTPMFSLSELRNAEYITHMVQVGKGTDLQSEESKLKYTEDLLRRYAKARLVVTGRIHCALPCLAVDTPVLFTNGSYLKEGSTISSADRFGGLLDLLNVCEVKGMSVLSSVDTKNVKNPSAWRVLAERLRKQCEEFVGGTPM